MLVVERTKTAESHRVKYSKIIADNLKKVGLEFGLGRSSRSERANNLDC
jgi:hypothetical protein